MNSITKVILLILVVALAVWGVEWMLTEHFVHKFSGQ